MPDQESETMHSTTFSGPQRRLKGSTVPVQLFQVAIIHHPTKKQREDGEKSKIVLEPVTVLANDAMAAGMTAMRDHPEATKDIDLERSEVLVRPF